MGLCFDQLPPLFNIPKSHLQCYGESVYSVNKDMLSKCAHEETAVDRMIAVIGWSISTVRPLTFGVAPYNPVLGETHHVSRGSLNVLLEQVCLLFFYSAQFFGHIRQSHINIIVRRNFLGLTFLKFYCDQNYILGQLLN